MKTVVIITSVALLAATALSGAAEARPGRGHAYGHYRAP